MIPLTPEQQATLSKSLLEQFSGMQTGDVITVLAIALQMAICYGAKNKVDALDMISKIAEDCVRDMPRQYDIVQAIAQRPEGKLNS